jgi:hypothetical protein
VITRVKDVQKAGSLPGNRLELARKGRDVRTRFAVCLAWQGCLIASRGWSGMI